MARIALDEAAWSGPWRHRSTLEKCVLALGLLLVAVTSRSIVVSALVCVLTAGLALAAARVPWRAYLLAISVPGAFTVAGASILTVSLGTIPQADRVISLGDLAMTWSGLQLAAEVAARSLAGTSALVLFAMTTPMHDTLRALRALRLPETVVDVAGLMYRLLFSLLDSAMAIREAQASRLGFSTPRAARQSVGMLAAATLRRALDQSTRLEAGLAGRGYDGRLRTLNASSPVSMPFVVGASMLVGVLLALSSWTAVAA